MSCIGCEDMSLILPDIDLSIRDVMISYIRLTRFRWNSKLLGVGCDDMELIMLPCDGYAYIQVVCNPGVRLLLIFLRDRF